MKKGRVETLSGMIACRSGWALVSIVWNDLAFILKRILFSHRAYRLLLFYFRVCECVYVCLFSFSILDFSLATWKRTAICYCSCIWRFRYSTREKKNIISSRVWVCVYLTLSFLHSFNHILSRFLPSDKQPSTKTDKFDDLLNIFCHNQLFTLWMHFNARTIKETTDIFVLPRFTLFAWF